MGRTVPIRSDLVERRRLQQGLSYRELARQLAVDTTGLIRSLRLGRASARLVGRLCRWGGWAPEELVVQERG